MKNEEMISLSERVLAAWNSQDVERVVACYTDDLVYRDPNTRGEVCGADAMRRYLSRLFSKWTMCWSLREAHPFGDGNGGAFLWRASFRATTGTETVEADGMDLVLVDGDRIQRNDVYFDRAVLGPLSMR